MFQICIKPLTVNQCFRSINGRSIKSKVYREFEKEVNRQLPNAILRELARQFKAKDHYIVAELWFTLPNCYTKKGLISKTAGDIDNFVKAFMDLVFKRLREFNPDMDDSQILEMKLVKTSGVEPKITTMLTLGNLNEFKAKLQICDLPFNNN